MKLKIAIHYSAVILAVSLFNACSNSNAEQQSVEKAANTDETLVQLTDAQAKNIGLHTGVVSLKNISSSLKLSGQIDVPPQNLVSVSIPLGGYLKSTQMLPGTQVRKGQLLAIMEDPQYIQLQQDYLNAKNKLAYAGREYERQKELNSSKASSDKVLQQSESEFRSLNIELKALAAKLGLIGINPQRLTENSISRSIGIHSPINGYISRVNVNIGKYVTPSDVIFELVNPTDIHLNLMVYEKDLSKLAIGQKAIVYSNARPDQRYDTKIILLSHSLNENRIAEVHCQFEKYDKRLVPGMYMNAEIQLDNNQEKVLPDDAIVGFENKDYVFVQEGNSSFRMTPVKKGQSENGLTVVGDGLEGKRIVTTGAYSLLMKLKNTAE
ncbi:efflux RND transporter periplasmic adaptor subunit [Pedobacter africanus]|uniref:Membrane fusion protein, cobalt-zinc-cadmium efflux system n=1 Tax=Pedobacter africanus TaxID=151894 RepID=A0A1W2A931_9SPHI|nr:efflux RND transporter periplasmic adaptor subunit [Pedobacter africanus]SMC56778.1 membrane fusion protein, cobalt-zinc-cadmium efflux system [Pedobacter africanus]